MSEINNKLSLDKSVQDVVQLLSERDLHVSCAESCTGGMISAAITSVDGSSKVLDLSVVTYANRAKTEYTDVTDEMLDAHGAVSAPVAVAMADGIRKRAGADIGVGVTGIAGSTGGTAEKPVGTVYISVCTADKQEVRHFKFDGGRDDVRIQTVEQALMLIKECID